MQKPLFVLINGLGGVGKTTTMKALIKNPPKNWVFFDFDDGKFQPVGGKSWRQAQHNWWIELASKLHKKQNINVCILGVGVFPWQARDLPSYDLLAESQYVYAVLTCTEKTRKQRLEKRGSSFVSKCDKSKFKNILEKMLDYNVKEFSTENSSPDEIAHKIKKWLNKLI